MSIVLLANLPRALGQAGLKLSMSTAAASSGLLAVVTGLNTIAPVTSVSGGQAPGGGGAIASATGGATSATTLVGCVTSISAGTVNASVALLTYSGPAIALGSTQKIIVWAAGY